MGNIEYFPRDDEIVTAKPVIFDDPSLDWVAYAETRRTSGGMSGNLSDRTGNMNLENYEIINPPLSYNEWLEQETDFVKIRHQKILARLSLSDIAYPNPVHGTNLIEVKPPIVSSSIHFEAQRRYSADAALVQTEGIASCVTPADCPVLNLVETKERSTLQIHAGYQGLKLEVVKKVFEKISPATTKNYLAYISPHAINGFAVYGAVLEDLASNAATRDFIYNRNDSHYFDLGAASMQHLIDIGIPESHIQLSTDDTLSQPELFSHRNRHEKGANGRNGIVLGIRNSHA